MVKQIGLFITLVVVSASSATTASAFAPRLSTKTTVGVTKGGNKVVPKVATTASISK
jgi:hypothetical protein